MFGCILSNWYDDCVFQVLLCRTHDGWAAVLGYALRTANRGLQCEGRADLRQSLARSMGVDTR